MNETLAVLPQYLLPKTLLTTSAGHLANYRGGSLTTGMIRRFIQRYGVNMAEAANPDPASYATFNEFFTRPLKDGMRPLADATWVSPVDGAVSQLGTIHGDQLLQAKGRYYSTTALVGGDSALAQQFQEGWFCTIYLSPKDYHRIHMPCDGELRRMIYVPGDLFSVNPLTARNVPGLFARNERVVCIFDTPHGPMALVLVGATIVGSMATAWHGVVNPPRRAEVTEWQYAPGQVRLRQGDEMGRFLLGSTVVMLWPQMGMDWQAGWRPAAPVRMGQSMAQA